MDTAREDVARFASRARALVRAGQAEGAADALESLLRAAGVDEVSVDLDDRARIVVATPFDPVLVDRLGHLPGARREAGTWRVPRGGQPALVDLLEILASPPCSEAGCVLGEDRPPSALHRDAHAAWCAPST